MHAIRLLVSGKTCPQGEEITRLFTKGCLLLLSVCFSLRRTKQLLSWEFDCYKCKIIDFLRSLDFRGKQRTRDQSNHMHGVKLLVVTSQSIIAWLDFNEEGKTLLEEGFKFKS